MPWEPLPSNAEREPTRLGRTLDRLVENLGGTSADVIGGVFTRWPEIVGEQVAAQSEPVALRDHTLTIAVSDPAWATQLQFLAPEILVRLAAEVGESAPTRLEVRVRRNRP